ncbi:MAG: hypothetical protein ACJ77A_01300 [Actinomycetota bacterium]
MASRHRGGKGVDFRPDFFIGALEARQAPVGEFSDGAQVREALESALEGAFEQTAIHEIRRRLEASNWVVESMAREGADAKHADLIAQSPTGHRRWVAELKVGRPDEPPSEGWLHQLIRYVSSVRPRDEHTRVILLTDRRLSPEFEQAARAANIQLVPVRGDTKEIADAAIRAFASSDRE